VTLKTAGGKAARLARADKVVSERSRARGRRGHGAGKSRKAAPLGVRSGKARSRSEEQAARVVMAVPKGRVLPSLVERLARAGVDGKVLLEDDRTLVRDDPRSGIRFLLLKPDDVPTYVEYGAADLGVVGRDILLEREYDLYAPLDLGIGRCRLVVAGKQDLRAQSGRTLRVATKFVTSARRHFLDKGEHVDLVYVQSSVELAPLTGLADLIVDLVGSGETLRQNGLIELETICEISSVVIANRVALKLKRDRIARLLSALE
jgi:ATP phosphoribosyltransferase